MATLESKNTKLETYRAVARSTQVRGFYTALAGYLFSAAAAGVVILIIRVSTSGATSLPEMCREPGVLNTVFAAVPFVALGIYTGLRSMRLRREAGRQVRFCSRILDEQQEQEQGQ